MHYYSSDKYGLGIWPAFKFSWMAKKLCPRFLFYSAHTYLALNKWLAIFIYSISACIIPKEYYLHFIISRTYWHLICGPVYKHVYKYFKGTCGKVRSYYSTDWVKKILILTSFLQLKFFPFFRKISWWKFERCKRFFHHSYFSLSCPLIQSSQELNFFHFILYCMALNFHNNSI